MLQYKIPQNVEVEDTIIGSITMKQLIILAVGGGTAYLFYISLAKYYFFEIWGPPVLFFSLTSIAIAFVEIHGIKFVKWGLLMLEAILLPQKRIWDKRQSTQFLFQNLSPKKVEPEKKGKEDSLKEKESQVNKLKELTKALDTSSVFDEKQKSPVASVKDHELSAVAIAEDDADRHNARLKNVAEDERISAIRGDSLPVHFTQVNTQKIHTIPDEHKKALANIKK